MINIQETEEVKPKRKYTKRATKRKKAKRVPKVKKKPIVKKEPKPKKVQPVDEQIKKLKYKISDDKLGIAGLSATHIVGAQTAVVFNTTTRKIGIYNSTGIEGLSVKGTSIINFNNNSKQKTLRKPVEQLKEIKTVNSIKKFNAWFNAVNSIDTDLTGRMNEDTLILKIFK